ncbi:hypothetical protein K8R43_01945 [archaeon]|nr:hypothetical protein [archaeon]
MLSFNSKIILVSFLILTASIGCLAPKENLALERIAESIISIPPVLGTSLEGMEQNLVLDGEDVTSKQVAQKVREIAKERNIAMHKDITSEQIKFVVIEGTCEPCEDEEIIVKEDQIEVKTQFMIVLKHLVKWDGKKYIIHIKDHR